MILKPAIVIIGLILLGMTQPANGKVIVIKGFHNQLPDCLAYRKHPVKAKICWELWLELRHIRREVQSGRTIRVGKDMTCFKAGKAIICTSGGQDS